MNKHIILSVHQLVDSLLRCGDIDSRVFNRSSMQEGIKIHSRFQEKQGSDYISEYSLSKLFVVDDIEINLQGRADGIIKTKDDKYIIDEIKSTVADLISFKTDNLEWHLGQAKCYALMFCYEQKKSSIGIRMTYIKQGKEKEKLVDNYFFLKDDLEQYVYSLLENYLCFYRLIFKHIEERNVSIKELSFPFSHYRKGQREFAKYAYAITKNSGRLYCEAPTGIGKTMSALFPFIKALTDDEKSKIFYLTAKTTGKEAAYEAIKVLKKQNFILKEIVITAKDKICFCPGKGCNPDECPFAKGYYNKIQSVLRYCFIYHSSYDLNTIVAIAKENEICPFEFELDLSLFCDVIICDYNYMFDPISHMKRYFDEDSSHHLALIDEAHNLADRSRDMYSASISSFEFDKARKSISSLKHSRLKRMMKRIKTLFDETRLVYEEGNTIVGFFSESLLKALNSFINLMQDLNKNEHEVVSRELFDFYLSINRFFKIMEYVNERFICYIRKKGKQVEFFVYCLDASRYIADVTNKIKGSVFFSATLSPMDYYVDILGGLTHSDPTIILPSPFPKDHLKVLVAPKISVKWKNRNDSYHEVAEYINSFIKNKVGNYFIYSPSYDYMDKLIPHIKLDDILFFKQEREMEEKDKQTFLEHFQPSPKKTTLGFIVLGGTFSEGINLVDDRLIGAVVIGIGLPKINFESDQIADYYSKMEKPGRDYAYLYPGMNKVMQAVGRVIRGEQDRGAVLLIEERYLNKQYQNLFRLEWNHYEVVLSPHDVSNKLSAFFDK